MIKEYLEYRKNKKNVKRKLIKMISSTLPLIEEITNHELDIIKFIIKLAEETKNTDGDKLFEMVLSELSNALKTDNNRIIEVLSYLVNLSPEEIQKIVIHSVVETSPKVK